MFEYGNSCYNALLHAYSLRNRLCCVTDKLTRLPADEVTRPLIQIDFIDAYYYYIIILFKLVIW